MPVTDNLFTVEAPSLVAVGAASIVDSAKALGLTWTLRPGTVTQITGGLKVRYDGDTEAITAIDLTNGVYVDNRIMGLLIPPAGNFILGPIGGPRAVSFTGSDSVSHTTNSGVYTEVLTPPGLCGCDFTAPATGSVMLYWEAEFENTNNGVVNAVSPIVRTGNTVGSGNTVMAAGVSAIRNDSTQTNRFAGFHLLQGLNPGGVYNISLAQVVGGGTMGVRAREVAVVHA